MVSVSAASEPTPAMVAGSHQGAATWTASIYSEAGQASEAAGLATHSNTWKDVVSTGRLRPDEKELLKAYNQYHCCGRRTSNAVCEDKRFPRCWNNSNTLDTKTVFCSRFNQTASAKASSGTGRWKEGNARAAGSDYGTSSQDEWAFGAWSGENVEIHKGKLPYTDDPDANTLTMVKIVCFFSHIGNKRSSGGGGQGASRPTTDFVLGFEYVTAGLRNARLPDVTTQHPIMLLSGRCRPRVWPVSGIRRHVHLYHLCPTQLHPVDEFGKERPESSTASKWICCIGRSSRGGAQVWTHKYRLSYRSEQGYDKYLLNEHHHSLYQDTFI